MIGHPGDVPARTRKRGDEAGLDRVAYASEYDWDFRGRLLRHLRSLRPTEHDDHLNVESYELSSKLGKTLRPASRISSLDQYVTTLYPAPLVQARIEGGIERSRHGRRWRDCCEHTDATHSAASLGKTWQDGSERRSAR